MNTPVADSWGLVNKITAVNRQSRIKICLDLGFLLFALLLAACQQQNSSPATQGSHPETQARDATRPSEFESILRLANAGDTISMTKLGLAYVKGAGVEKNPVEGIRWLEQAAAENNDEAQVSLSAIYLDGEIVPKDTKRAAGLASKSAAAGNSRAEAILGLLYLTGEVLEQDQKRGLNLLESSVKKGDRLGQNVLAGLLSEGTILSRDYKRAFDLYELSSKQGHADSTRRMALALLEGRGVTKNTTRAYETMKPLAVAGDPMAQAQIGYMYYTGKGVPRDRVLGYAWINLAMPAIEQTNEAMEFFFEMEAEMENTEVAEAQKLSSQWKNGDDIKR